MPRLIALEWDDAEARVAVAEVRRGSMTLEQAFAVALPAGLTPGAAATSETVSASGAHDLGAIGRRIGAALLARGVRKNKTLVAVGRANIELKNLTLPPSPPEELPELVRFQAEREFNALGDDWPLDFIPQPGAANEPQTVLAAAISPDLVGEIQATCEAAGLAPERLVLRPCAAASLLSRIHPAEENKLRLLVDLLADEADLTVLAGDTVVFLRTARLPHDLLEADPLRALLPEIRRTIAAVQNRFQGQYVAEVFLCGAGADQEMLVREIGRDLNLPAELFHPLTCCSLSAELQRAMPDQPSRFAPLVGMLLDESAGGGTAVIDFLNPRRKPKQRSQRRKYALPAAAAAVVFLAGAGWLWLRLNSLDGQIEELAGTSGGLDATVKLAQEKQQEAAQIESWLAGDVGWLDELAALSEKAPPAQKLMLTKITSLVPTQSSVLGNKDTVVRGTVQMSGIASDRGVSEQLQRGLRDGTHQVTAPNVGEQGDSDKYPWSFNADVRITKASKPAATSRAAAPSAADKKPTPTPPASKKSADAAKDKTT